MKEHLILPFERGGLERESGCQRLRSLEGKEKERQCTQRGWHKQRIRLLLLLLSGNVESRNRLFQQTFHDIFKWYSRFSQIVTNPHLRRGCPEEQRQEDHRQQWSGLPEPQREAHVRVTPVNASHHVHLMEKMQNVRFRTSRQSFKVLLKSQ